MFSFRSKKATGGSLSKNTLSYLNFSLFLAKVGILGMSSV